MHMVPEGWKLPSCHVRYLWNLFIMGNETEQIAPYLLLKQNDMHSLETDKKLNWKKSRGMKGKLSTANRVFSLLLKEQQLSVQKLRSGPASQRNDAFKTAWVAWTQRFYPERANQPHADRRIGDMCWTTFEREAGKWLKAQKENG